MRIGRLIETISEAFRHASVLVTSTICNHWGGGLRAPVDSTDVMLERVS